MKLSIILSPVAALQSPRKIANRLQHSRNLKRVLKPHGSGFRHGLEPAATTSGSKGKKTLGALESPGQKSCTGIIICLLTANLKKTAEQAGLAVMKIFPESAYPVPGQGLRGISACSLKKN